MLYPLPDKEYIYHVVMGRFFKQEEVNPALNLLSLNYELIRDEFRSVKDGLVWTNWHGKNQYTSIEKNPYAGWRVAALYGEYDSNEDYDHIAKMEKVYDQACYIDPEKEILYTQNAVKMPNLFKLAYESGIFKRVGISVLHPGKSIPWHVDTDPEHPDYVIIRGLWGIDVNPQDNEVCTISLDTKDSGVLTEDFLPNRYHFFWGRTPHMVHNTLTTPRYCLCFDIEVNRNDLL